ncbi:adenosylcobinamide-GDP ribazoletransferase [Motilibacter peucedani]|uniref:Adenosylcobinamide-GDP ribazoletransferase n=1 Tax=Motilibacter peucedani TaxID=598650 RepID=A0A420XP92_9ACTN|nr:adenosylcobinamide-GDP ribazoletransferase [Motilibacter peucedani]RKS74021.1 adenosylcobinamide-GDP ribazoletransferase [Motilibacter peucedani]
MLPDGLRLSLGTFVALPVPAPRRVDRQVAGQAMLLAPAVGLALGAVAGALSWAVQRTSAGPLLAAALALGVLALATRALHLDGLADTADGLGSGRPAAGALEVMKRSDIGPFGVVTLVLVLLVDVAAAAQLPSRALAVAALAGRAGVTLACRRGVPSARPGGLGATVAGSVAPGAALAVGVLAAGAASAVTLDWRGAVAVAAAVVGAELLVRHCVRRLGGISGDVLGAVVEVGTAVALVALCLCGA